MLIAHVSETEQAKTPTYLRKSWCYVFLAKEGDWLYGVDAWLKRREERERREKRG
jgi:hypothetical protein